MIQQGEEGKLNFFMALQGTAGTNTTWLDNIISFDNNNGNITAKNFTLGSSGDTKENIRLIDNLDKFDSISIKQFNYKSDIHLRTRYGVIAEEVETIAPEVVYGKDTNKTIGYIDLLLAKVARLEERIKIMEDIINESS